MKEIIALMKATMEKFFAKSRMQTALSGLDKQRCSLSNSEDCYFHQGKWRRRGAWR